MLYGFLRMRLFLRCVSVHMMCLIVNLYVNVLLYSALCPFPRYLIFCGSSLTSFLCLCVCLSVDRRSLLHVDNNFRQLSNNCNRCVCVLLRAASSQVMLTVAEFFVLCRIIIRNRKNVNRNRKSVSKHNSSCNGYSSLASVPVCSCLFRICRKRKSVSNHSSSCSWYSLFYCLVSMLL